MRLRNTTQAPISFLVRMNPNEKVEVTLDNGSTIQKPAKPVLKHIAIPSEAEVELDDDIFEKMTKTKTTAQVYDEQWEDIDGLKDPKIKLKRKILVPTGKTRTISLVQERIRMGELVITEKPKSKATIQEMVDKLREMKINITKESHSNEEVTDLYERLFG